MTGNMQQSDARLTQNGIESLNQARNEIVKSRQHVETLKDVLRNKYKGGDGAAYGELLRLWDEKCAIVQRNVEDMIDKLGGSRQTQARTQAAAMDSIAQGSATSQAVFDALKSA
ncbi:hypothetical protein ACH4D4_28895 [Streptomyces pristinaespiralis]|uniref:hypothetical protein n=1 Tax=Streptomyces pristinaespiralis TaxID=38300 RepID=UPI0037B056BD